MGGQILDYEAKDIRNKGIQSGITIGKEEGEEMALKLIQLLIKLMGCGRPLRFSTSQFCHLFSRSRRQRHSGYWVKREIVPQR